MRKVAEAHEEVRGRVNKYMGVELCASVRAERRWMGGGGAGGGVEGVVEQIW